MSPSLHLVEAILGPLADLSAREELKGSIVAADDGCAETLRWSGSLAFLMDTVQVQSIVSLQQLVASLCHTDEDDDETGPNIHHLLDPWMSGAKSKLLLITSRPLVELQPVLAALLHADVLEQLVLASALPEKAHGPTFSFDSFRDGLVPKHKGLHADTVRLVYLPLLYAPLLDSSREGGTPGLFTLTHPQCASVFPLMRSQLKTQTQDAATPWEHVQDVAPQDIPEATRKAFKCLAHVLGAILMQWQFEVKERIFALGATSLKVGHTLQHFLHQLEEECTMTELKEFQPATLILVDRTCDLATPSSHQYTLLDRILQLLPPTPASDPATSTADHLVEVGPLYSTPSPAPPSIVKNDVGLLQTPSAFLANVQWKGGARICHTQPGPARRVFQSLVTGAPIAALKHLGQELRDVGTDLVKQRLTPVPEKKEQARGRDVILRWLKCIGDCVDATVTWQHAELLEIGTAVLETVERMEATDESAWKVLAAVEKDFASRIEYPEWIVPGLVEWLVATQQDEKRDGASSLDLRLVFELCIYAFALTGDRPMDDHTEKTFRTALKATLRANAGHALLPRDIGTTAPATTTSAGNAVKDDEQDEWDDWDAQSNPPSPVAAAASHDPVAEAAVDAYVGTVVQALKECGQLYKEMPSALPDMPPALLPRLVKLLSDPTLPNIPKLKHVTDASEQLTRAGMDLLKSGLSVFGFGGQEAGLQKAVATAHCKSNETTILFVVGGITLHEMQAISEALKMRPDLHVVVGSTTLTNPTKIQRHVWHG
ncbi:Aste57867_14343 [Aphanomyces stellatus]|uniref:Aste57867_14343 protein n=1 Tax=Aphanomyces stellatus TaxID=120398 RepID=A0A485L2V3_9STRA|nr:hypothetical protein As57867_014289 [Aphanomyces stellatus]VFT91167.1 Aste57867_14343 [Aphanomyces stellatus]